VVEARASNYRCRGKGEGEGHGEAKVSLDRGDTESDGFRAGEEQIASSQGNLRRTPPARVDGSLAPQLARPTAKAKIPSDSSEEGVGLFARNEVCGNLQGVSGGVEPCTALGSKLGVLPIPLGRPGDVGMVFAREHFNFEQRTGGKESG